MDLPDVNVLVYAHREDAADHRRYRDWVTTLVNSSQAYAMSDHVLSSFIRVVTNPAIFTGPTSLSEAIATAVDLRSPLSCARIAPGPRHWDLFTSLCRDAKARGNLISDAWLAALAIESGCELVTTDRDFARFPGLKWRHPLQ
jgi:hypothetical protein